MVSPHTLYLSFFHHAKLQILLHGVTANSLYLTFSPCEATNLTTWCHRKQSLLILFSPCKATNLTTCHRKQSLLILFSPCKATNLTHGVTANSLYLNSSLLILFSPCKATNLTYFTTSYKSLRVGILFTIKNSLYLIPWCLCVTGIITHGENSFSPCHYKFLQLSMGQVRTHK